MAKYLRYYTEFIARGGHGIGIKEGISRELDLGFGDCGRAAG